MKKVLLLLAFALLCAGCRDADGLNMGSSKRAYSEYKIDVAAGRDVTLEQLEQTLRAEGDDFYPCDQELMLRLYKERAEKSKN